MHRDTIIRLLVEMADIVDKPGGPGGGAILLEAVAEIEAMQRQAVAAAALAVAAETSADDGVTRCPACWTMWVEAKSRVRPDPLEWR